VQRVGPAAARALERRAAQRGERFAQQAAARLVGQEPQAAVLVRPEGQPAVRSVPQAEPAVARAPERRAAAELDGSLPEGVVAQRAPAALRRRAAAAPLASGAAVPEQRPVRQASSAARLPAFSVALSLARLPGRD